jgi:hypothetical protein
MLPQQNAYCILCNAVASFNPQHPYCNVCANSCNSFDLGASSVMPPYYCHQCGESAYVSNECPICHDCVESNNAQDH